MRRSYEDTRWVTVVVGAVLLGALWIAAVSYWRRNR